MLNSKVDADFSSIEDTCLSVRSLMLLEAENLRNDTLVSMAEGCCNQEIADKLEAYADMLDVK